MTLQILHLGDELHDAFVHSLRTVDHPECSSDYEHKCYDAGLLAEAFIQGRKNLPGLRLASRHKPGGDGADQQNSKYDYVSIWYLEFCHFYNLVMHRTLQDFRQSRMGMDNIFKFLKGRLTRNKCTCFLDDV